MRNAIIFENGRCRIGDLINKTGPPIPLSDVEGKLIAEGSHSPQQ